MRIKRREQEGEEESKIKNVHRVGESKMKGKIKKRNSGKKSKHEGGN